MVTADPLAPMPSDPGDRPGAISGFALILSLPQPGNCQGPKYRGPTSSRAGPSRQVVQGRRSGRGDQPRGRHGAGHRSQQLARDHDWARVLQRGLRLLLTLSPSHPLI